MTYYIRPVERDLMPDGHDWLFVRERGGDAHFVIAADAGAVVLPPAALESIIRDVCEVEEIPLAAVS